MSTTKQTELSYASASQEAKNIKTSAGIINDILEKSTTAVKGVARNWEGNAASTAIEEWDNWKKDFDEYYNMLLKNVQNIESACDTFAKGEGKMQVQFEEIN